jgi:N-acetylmuramoyl-L-alanine amidase
MQISIEHLPYVEKLDRRAREPDIVVIHCTELPDLAAARVEGMIERYPSGTGYSGHFYIDRDGAVSEYVPVERIAHHTRGWNARSVGIELVNTGRYPDWLAARNQTMTEAYGEPQLIALLALLRWLTARWPSITDIAGHEDLDLTEVPASDDPTQRVRRKRDPGPLFPWSRVVEQSGLRRRLSSAIP